jgi:hypothetical protein
MSRHIKLTRKDKMLVVIMIKDTAALEDKPDCARHPFKIDERRRCLGLMSDKRQLKPLQDI